MTAIHLEKGSRIYVICPSRIVTGGIEAVHQLVDKLNLFGHRAAIVPTPPVKNPVLLQYRNYAVEFCDEIIDDPRNLLITTEVRPRALDAYHRIQKALWWLSVDNHEKLEEKFDFNRPAARGITHLVQSAYAREFLRGRGIANPLPLSDYLHATYLQKPASRRQKRDLVLYTPVKGSEAYVQQLMQADPSIEWLALRGMIRKMHARTLRRGKVYVDFGTHPGKDRQPREAAVNGCCVIVGRKGAACFDADLPIPQAYKFDCETFPPEKIIETVRSCLNDYDNRIEEMAAYAEKIRQEERIFEQEVRTIFGGVSRRRSPLPLLQMRNTGAFLQQNDFLTGLRGVGNEFLPLAPVNAARRIYRQLRGR